jgi:uncharacterized membrane protein
MTAGWPLHDSRKAAGEGLVGGLQGRPHSQWSNRWDSLRRARRTRSFLKAVSWRAAGSIDTFVISLFVTGKLSLAGTIALVEVITKTVLYYFHERVWAMIPWGR